MPETTLKALVTHSELAELLMVDGGNCEEVLAELGQAGIDRRCFGCAATDRGSLALLEAWDDSMDAISSKSASLNKSGTLKAVS
jgi:hypothetical protein